MKRSRRLASNRQVSKQSRQSLPRWASWTDSGFQPDEEITEEDLWLRLQAFSIVSKEIQKALERSLTETATSILTDISELVKHLDRDNDEKSPENALLEEESKNNDPSANHDAEPPWKQFVIHEKAPCYKTALPILIMDSLLDQHDRTLWMNHLYQLLRAKQSSRPKVFLFEKLEDFIQHRFSIEEEDIEYIYMIETVESARMFAKCVQELAETIDACLIVLQPVTMTLDAERWSVDAYVKRCSLPTTPTVMKEFWKRMEDFPLAVDQGEIHSSLSATVRHILRSSANLLAHEGSFWAVAPILPPSLIQRARSIHTCHSVIHMLPAMGCIPPEWNTTAKKRLLERLVQRYNALPRQVQLTARQSLHQSILWLHEATTRQQVIRLIFPEYDGDAAQPRRETVRALMETNIGEHWVELDQRDASAMDPYSKRHLAVCGLVRVLKNGAVEKKAHVWCAGD